MKESGMATLTIGLARGDTTRGFTGCNEACTSLIGQPAEHPASPFLLARKAQRMENMGVIVFGIVMAVVLVIALAIWASQDCEWYNIIAAFTALIFGIATGVTIIAFCFAVWEWNAAEYKASIINREYKTSYTREEIFYGSDVIDTIRNLDRTRMEINGNILRDK